MLSFSDVIFVLFCFVFVFLLFSLMKPRPSVQWHFFKAPGQILESLVTRAKIADVFGTQSLKPDL